MGPALGGLIYGFYGLIAAYSVDIALFVFSIVFIALIKYENRIVRNEKESLRESLSVGLKFVFANDMLLGAISLDLFAVLFGGAVVLLPVFASDILKTGPQGLGFLRAAPAVGAIVMAVVMAYRPPTKKAGRKLFVNVALFGLFTILFALSSNMYLSLFLLALMGAVDNVSVVIRSTILQLATPDEMRGRVSSVNYIFIGSSNEIGAFESGLAARLMGLIPSVIFGGGMTVLTVAAIFRGFPKLKKLDL
jgi:MFS family permease